MQEPTICRIVHFTLPNGYTRPAIITHVHGGDLVNLKVFLDQNSHGVGNDHGMRDWYANVSYSENNTVCTWRYPARV